MSTVADSTEIELELTYLAAKLPEEIQGVEPTRLMDVYIPETGVDHPCLRLRQKGVKYEITKKYPVNDGDASVQVEMTVPLDEGEFNALIAVSQKRVIKDRYNVMIAGHPAEVDVFREGLSGLVLIDFEFKNENDKAAFVQPSVALREVTQEEFIAGGLLAGKTYEDIRQKLDVFNYSAL